MLNGIISVAIAYGVYRALVGIDLMIVIANSIAYLSGTTYGFIANKHLAFHDEGAVSVRKMVRYVLLHAATLLVNMGVNATMLAIQHDLSNSLSSAFLMAIAASTVLNFFGMKYWVFKQHSDLNASIDSEPNMIS